MPRAIVLAFQVSARALLVSYFFLLACLKVCYFHRTALSLAGIIAGKPVRPLQGGAACRVESAARPAVMQPGGIAPDRAAVSS